MIRLERVEVEGLSLLVYGIPGEEETRCLLEFFHTGSTRYKEDERVAGVARSIATLFEDFADFFSRWQVLVLTSMRIRWFENDQTQTTVFVDDIGTTLRKEVDASKIPFCRCSTFK